MECSNKTNTAIMVAKRSAGGSGYDPQLKKILNDPSYFDALEHTILAHAGEFNHKLPPDALEALALYAEKGIPEAQARFMSVLRQLRRQMIAALSNYSDEESLKKAQNIRSLIVQTNITYPEFSEDELSDQEKAQLVTLIAAAMKDGDPLRGWGNIREVLAASITGMGNRIMRVAWVSAIQNGYLPKKQELLLLGRIPQSPEILLAIPDCGRFYSKKVYLHEALNLANKAIQCYDARAIPYFAQAIRSLTANQLDYLKQAFPLLEANPSICPEAKNGPLTPIMLAAAREYERHKKAGGGSHKSRKVA